MRRRLTPPPVAIPTKVVEYRGRFPSVSGDFKIRRREPDEDMKMEKMDEYDGRFPNGGDFDSGSTMASLTDRLFVTHLPSAGRDRAGSSLEEAPPPPTPDRRTINVKNTFIDVDVDETPPAGLRRSNSAPALLCQPQLSNDDDDDDDGGGDDGDDGANEQDMLSTATATDDDESMPTSELHKAGRCQPCAYFAFKADGCRRGADCERCHLCTYDEIMRRARELKKAKKSLRKLLLQQQDESQRQQEESQRQQELRRAWPPAAPRGCWPDAAPAGMEAAPFRTSPPGTFVATPPPGDHGLVSWPARTLGGHGSGGGPARALVPAASREWQTLPAPYQKTLPAPYREWHGGGSASWHVWHSW